MQPPMWGPLQAGNSNRPQEPGNLFSEKVALSKENQFDGKKQRSTWKTTTRNYFLTKATDIDYILDLVEAHEDVPAKAHDIGVALRGILRSARVQYLAEEVWGYLNLNLTDAAREIFENVPRREGFEAWRKFLKIIGRRCEVCRIELTPKIQSSQAAATLSEVQGALEKWDTDVRHYREAGGRPLSYDERRVALISILPDKVRRDMLMRIHTMSEPYPGATQQEQDAAYRELRATLEKQLELCTQFEAITSKKKSANTNLMGEEQPEDRGEGEYPQEELDPDNPLYSVLSPIYAFIRSWKGGKGKGKGNSYSNTGAGGKGDGKGKGKCINSGRTGHRAAECRQPKRDTSQRPCFNCGKPGHQADQCPERTNKAANLAAGGEKLSFALCVSSEQGYTVTTRNRYSALTEDEENSEVPQTESAIGRTAVPCEGSILNHPPQPEERVLLSPVDDKEMIPPSDGTAVKPIERDRSAG